MAIELSNLIFSDQNDVVPVSGVEEILNTGVANTLAGNDTITSTGTKFKIHPSIGILGTGFHNIGTLNTAEGNDRITGIHSPDESEPYPPNPTGQGNVRSYGIFNERGTIDTGDGNDLITGISEAKEGIGSHSTFYPFGIENYDGIINTGNGHDIIVGIGDIGIYNDFDSTLDTGNGNDLITGTGRFGILNFIATIETSSGRDIIAGTSNDLYGGGLANFGSINTGDDNDIITGTAITGTGLSNYENSTIDTGDGNDRIIITSTGSGLQNYGTINMGNGADSLIINAASSNSMGSVFLDNGNDYIKSFGHSGNLKGGDGEDTLELPSGSYVIGISETTVNFTQPHPSISNNTMKTSEFEKLIAGGTTYDFSSLTTGQTIFVG
jgi:hypothetical protein